LLPSAVETHGKKTPKLMVPSGPSRAPSLVNGKSFKKNPYVYNVNSCYLTIRSEINI
jgi:hypothetical protein